MKPISDDDLQLALADKANAMKLRFYEAFPTLSALDLAKLHQQISVLDGIAKHGFMNGSGHAVRVVEERKQLPTEGLTNKQIYQRAYRQRNKAKAAKAARARRAAKKAATVAEEPSRTPPERSRHVVDGPYARMKQTEAIRIVLADHPDGITALQITQALIDGGYPFNTNKPVESVAIAMGNARKHKVAYSKKADARSVDGKMMSINQWFLVLPKVSVSKINLPKVT
jgi:hypothetical protein